MTEVQNLQTTFSKKLKHYVNNNLINKLTLTLQDDLATL